MAETVKCAGCGSENRKGDNFCGACGARLTGGQITCPHCEASIDSGSNFCPWCGKPTKIEKQEQTSPGGMDGMRWKRGIDDFALRIDLDRTETAFQTGVVVEEGTRALLLKNGALSATLEPGYYDLKTFMEALKESVVRGGGAIVRGVAGWFSDQAAASVDKAVEAIIYHPCTVLLIDSGDVELKVDISSVYTKDPLMLDVSCTTVLRLDNASLFFVNVLKNRTDYNISALRSKLYEEMHNAFSEAIGQKSAAELHSNLSLKLEFENTVKEHLNKTLGQSYGLRFFQLRTLHYRNNRYDKIKNIHEETYLLVSEDEAKLQKRQRLFDVYSQTQLQEIFEETKDIEYREQRQKIWARMRDLVNSDKMDEVTSADQLEAFMLEINKGKYLREEEILDLKNTFEQSARKRDFLLRKIDLEQSIDLLRIQKKGASELELELADLDIKKKRLELEDEIYRARAQKTAERDEWLKDEMAKIEADKAGDMADLEVARMSQELVHNMQQKKVELQLHGERERMLIEMQGKRDQLEIDMQRIQAMSQASGEVLISMSGPEQAKLIAELQRTKAMQGMTSEQILAFAAEKSPEVAKAFQEKYMGFSVEEREKLYKQMMEQKDQSMQVMQEMFNKALETQRDATVGVAQGGRIVYPPYPGGGYGMPYGPSEGSSSAVAQTTVVTDASGREVKVVVCARCKSDVATGTKFCPNCGNEMY